MIQKIFAILRNTEQGFFRYLLNAFWISFIPSILLAVGLSFIGLVNEDSSVAELDFGATAQEIIFSVLIFAPWIETLLILCIILLLGKLIKNSRTLILSTAMFFAVLHSLVTPVWGLIVFWPFVVFTTALLEWKKSSLLMGICMAAGVHMCQNFLPALALIYDAGIR